MAPGESQDGLPTSPKRSQEIPDGEDGPKTAEESPKTVQEA